MSRAEVVAQAWRRYHAGEITLREVWRVLRDWRPKP